MPSLAAVGFGLMHAQHTLSRPVLSSAVFFGKLSGGWRVTWKRGKWLVNLLRSFRPSFGTANEKLSDVHFEKFRCVRTVLELCLVGRFGRLCPPHGFFFQPASPTRWLPRRDFKTNRCTRLR